jgi:hypothetical protein
LACEPDVNTLRVNPDVGSGKNFCDWLEQNAFAVFDNLGLSSPTANRSCVPMIALPISRWLAFNMPLFVVAPANGKKFFIFFAPLPFPE